MIGTSHLDDSACITWDGVLFRVVHNSHFTANAEGLAQFWIQIHPCDCKKKKTHIQQKIYTFLGELDECTLHSQLTDTRMHVSLQL